MRSRSSAQGAVGVSWWRRDSGGGARGLLWFLVASWGFLMGASVSLGFRYLGGVVVSAWLGVGFSKGVLSRSWPGLGVCADLGGLRREAMWPVALGFSLPSLISLVWVVGLFRGCWLVSPAWVVGWVRKVGWIVMNGWASSRRCGVGFGLGSPDVVPRPKVAWVMLGTSQIVGRGLTARHDGHKWYASP
uniref:Uncharacterized protein n=1 Tax=Fagus sylvatica TaxID=28930 RepID=A0A2N9I4W0_FAGSY